MASSRRIYLIGMMGSGKSTVGKAIAEVIQWDFRDTDQMIMDEAGLSISEIFERHGESRFRLMESYALETTFKSQPIVIATGGGLPCHHNNLEKMKANGLVIFIDVPIDILVDRLADSSDRPLAQGDTDSRRTQLKRLLDDRIEIYRKAHLSIDGTPSTRFVVDEIVGNLESLL